MDRPIGRDEIEQQRRAHLDGSGHLRGEIGARADEQERVAVAVAGADELDVVAFDDARGTILVRKLELLALPVADHRGCLGRLAVFQVGYDVVEGHKTNLLFTDIIAKGVFGVNLGRPSRPIGRKRCRHQG